MESDGPVSVIRVSTWAVSAADDGRVMVCTSDTHLELAHGPSHVITRRTWSCPSWLRLSASSSTGSSDSGSRAPLCVLCALVCASSLTRRANGSSSTRSSRSRTSVGSSSAPRASRRRSTGARPHRGTSQPTGGGAVGGSGGEDLLHSLPIARDLKFGKAGGEFRAVEVVSSVCHGYCGLLNTRLSDGSHLIAGRKMTGFA